MKMLDKIKAIFNHSSHKFKNRNYHQTQIAGDDSTLVQVGNINSSKKLNDVIIRIKVGGIDIEA